MRSLLHVTLSDIETPVELVERTDVSLRAYARLLDYRRGRKGAYEIPEDLVRLPYDDTLHRDAERLAERMSSTALRSVVLVGIGGSSLGTEAIYRALMGTIEKGNDTHPRLFVLDTLSSHTLTAVTEHLLEHRERHEFVVIIASKSGTTTETITNGALLLDSLARKFGKINDRIVVSSDPASLLAKWAESQEISLIPLPSPIGGRWSVLSAPGLFPLILVGVDTRAILHGARAWATIISDERRMHNPAMLMASTIVAALNDGRSILDLFYFDPRMETLGKWARQLIAESLGKEFNRKGARIASGITPTVSIGSTDLHSMAQLTLAGPKDKLTFFFRQGDEDGDTVSPRSSLGKLVGGLSGRSPARILSAIAMGTERAYHMRKLPAVHIATPRRLTPEAIGAYIVLMEGVVMYTAEILGVNAFDQPSVEEYKAETRRVLGLHSREQIDHKEHFPL